MKRRWAGFLIVVVVLAATIGCDQSTKAIARATLPGSGVHRVIGSILILVYADNEGGFLSLGARWPPAVRRAIFTVLSVLIVALLLVYLVSGRRLNLPTSAALALVAGGGVGNLVDRILHNGHVTDFINIGIGPVRTGIFNVADFCILTGGVALVLIQVFARGRSGEDRQSRPRRG